MVVAFELVERIPGGLERYRPSLNYLLLDDATNANATGLAEAEVRELRNQLRH